MLKILICDDDEIFLKSLKKDILKIAGDRVNSIEIFKEKEQLDFYIADSVNEVNVAIIDIKVNSDNGIDIAREILETRPNCQIYSFPPTTSIFWRSILWTIYTS